MGAVNCFRSAPTHGTHSWHPLMAHTWTCGWIIFPEVASLLNHFPNLPLPHTKGLGCGSKALISFGNTDLCCLHSCVIYFCIKVNLSSPLHWPWCHGDYRALTICTTLMSIRRGGGGFCYRAACFWFRGSLPLLCLTSKLRFQHLGADHPCFLQVTQPPYMKPKYSQQHP